MLASMAGQPMSPAVAVFAPPVAGAMLSHQPRWLVPWPGWVGSAQTLQIAISVSPV